MGVVSESYVPKPMTANQSVQVKSGPGQLGGFLCTVSGTITVYDALTATGTPIVPATMPVTAGVFHSMPFSFALGLFVILAGGAVGTVAYA